MKYASERLNEFNTSQMVGPLPVDAILGNDARTRARNRLELQQQLEQGFHGMPPLSPDSATEMLDRAAAQAPAVALEHARLQLQDLGMSPQGAEEVLTNLNRYTGYLSTGVEQYADAVPTGKHALDGLSKADAAALGRIAGHVGKVTDVVTLGLAVDKWFEGGPNRNEELGAAAGTVAGGAGGAWAAGTAAAMFAGPWTAAGVAIAGAIVGGEFGDHIGGGIGSLFDAGIPGSGGKSW